MPFKLARAHRTRPNILVLDIIRMPRGDFDAVIGERSADTLRPGFEFLAVRIVAVVGDEECG